ncbi:hypothetical protein, partial [Bacteroides sp.]
LLFTNQAVGALTLHTGVRNRHMKHQDRHKNACHETRQVPCLVDMKSITKIRQFSSLSRIKGKIKGRSKHLSFSFSIY